MAEIVGLMAALDEEGAGIGADVLAALGKPKLGLGRHRDQEFLGPLRGQMARQAAVESRVGGQPREGDRAKVPTGQFPVERLGPPERQVERKVGAPDRLVPVTAARRRVDPVRGDGGLHRRVLPSASVEEGRMPCKAAFAVRSAECAQRQKTVRPAQRPAFGGGASLPDATVQRTPRDREYPPFRRAFRPTDALLRGLRREAR